MNTTNDTITIPLSLNSNYVDRYFSKLERIDKSKPFCVAYEKAYQIDDEIDTTYRFMTYNSFEEFNELTKDENKSNKRWRELILENNPVVECYDLDAKAGSKMFDLYKNNTEDYVIDEFKNYRQRFMEMYYPAFEAKETFAISTACTKDKFSVHIAVRNGYYFENMSKLKIFMKQFELFLKNTTIEFDMSIYKKNQQIRMLNNLKFGKNNTLVKHRLSRDMNDKDFLFGYVKEGDKLFNVKEPEKVSVENYEKPNLIFLENNDYKEMTQLLNLVNSSDCDETKWSTVAQYIYNNYNGSDEGLDTFIKWSEKDDYIDFDKDKCNNLWRGKTVKDSYGDGINQLKSLAKIDSPKEYEKLYPEKSFLKNDSCPDDVGATYPNSHLDCGLFMIDKIKESGEIYYYNKKKTIFIYNDKLKIFEEQPIDKIMNFIPTFLLPVLQSVGAKLYQQSPKTKEEEKSHQEKIKQVSKMIENIKSTPYQRNILTQIINRIEHSDDFIEKYFNRVPNLFPIADNKVIDFQTLEVMERTKEHYFTYTTDNVYFPDRPKKDDVYKYVSEILKTDNKDFITSFLTWNGYCLTGENCVKSIVFWTGDGDNGKSVAFNIFKKITGKSGVVGNDKVFTVSPRQSDSCHTDEYLPLIGKRSTYISEVKKGCKFNERLMKHISGNDGNLSLRGCGGTTLEVNIDCKMIGIVNSSDMPSFETEGFDNRIKIFPFANKFEKNPKKVKEIENMKDDIFTEFCYYVKNHFYDNDMNINFSQEIEKATTKYKISNDTVKMFFDTTIEITDNGKDRIPKTEIWNKYNDFCFEGEYQHIKLKKVEFYAYIETKLKLDIHKKTHYKCVKYIVIKNEPDDDDE